MPTPAGSATCAASTCTTSTASSALLELVTEGAEQAVLARGGGAGGGARVQPGRAAAGRDLPRGDGMTTTQRTDRPAHDDPTTGREPDGSTGREAALPRAWALVARREVSSKLVDRTFLLGTLVTLLLIAGMVVAAGVPLRAGRRLRPRRDPGRRPRWPRSVADRATGLDDKVHVARRAGGRRRRGQGRADRRGGRRLAHARGRRLGARRAVTRCRATSRPSPATVVRDSTLAENAEAAGTTVAAMTARQRADHRRARRGRRAARLRQGDGLRPRLPLLPVLDRLRHDPRGQRRRGEAVAHRRDHRHQDPGAPAARRQGARQHRRWPSPRWRCTRPSAWSG